MGIQAVYLIAARETASLVSCSWNEFKQNRHFCDVTPLGNEMKIIRTSYVISQNTYIVTVTHVYCYILHNLLCCSNGLGIHMTSEEEPHEKLGTSKQESSATQYESSPFHLHVYPMKSFKNIEL